MDISNYHKQDMASVDWLAKHFFAKSNDRLRQITGLPIYKGDKVIDLCCGPGFYLRYFADLVGPEGHVTGIDHDPLSLDFAQRYLAGFPYRNWSLDHEDLSNYDHSRFQHFDVVIIFNAIGYFESPMLILDKIINNLKSGSRLIIKDFDLESIFLSPLESHHFVNLIENAKKQDLKSNPLKFTNFFGRKVHSLNQDLNCKRHVNEIWSQAMSYPFNEYEKEYIWRNIEALILQAEPTCPKKTISYFKDAFCKEEKPFFNEKQGLFIENEYITTLFV